MLTFPTHLFNPARIAIRPSSVVIEGGESLTGEVDVIRTDGGGHWVCDMMGIQLLTIDHVRAWRAWQDELDAGVTRVLVPIADVRFAPRPLIGRRLARPSDLHPGSADPYFPEAVGFASPLIVATITEPAALRDTELVITVTRGARIKGGEMLAINHPTQGRRVYRCGRVLARPAEQVATVKIRPPLREAVADNTVADFDWPSFVGTLVPNTDITPEIEVGCAPVNISFREAFDAAG